jgi:hypothetical protein
MTLRAPGVARVGLGRRPRVLQRINDLGEDVPSTC